MTTNNNWKTTLTGFLTGVVLLVNSLALPLLGGDLVALDWTGIAAGLGAMGLGWFARDGSNKNETPSNEEEEDETTSEADDDYDRWTQS